MKLSLYNGVTSVILRVKILDTSRTDGQGLTGLTSGSSGLVVSTIADVEATATVYSGSNLETISTLGTYAAPTSGKARFKEVDATNHKGLYEIHLADARFAVSGARSLIVTVYGAANAADVDAEIELQDLAVATRGVRVVSYVSGQAPLQPTVAGRTLDVSTTGEAGLDFDNVKDASASHTLTNIVVPLVTDVSTKTGYALTSSERDSIAAALLDLANSIETGLTFREYLRGAASALLGKNTGTAAAPTFNNAVANTKTRISSSSDRTSLTLDLT